MTGEGVRATQGSSYAPALLGVLLAEEREAGQDVDGSAVGGAPVPVRGDQRRRKTEQKTKQNKIKGRWKFPASAFNFYNQNNIYISTVRSLEIKGEK